MRLMPKVERDAMFAIYAFCRRVDDIADDGIGTRAERHEKLEAWRYDLDALYSGQTPGRVAFLAPAVARFGLRKEDFLTILDGMDMDVAEDIVAPDLAHARSVLRTGGQRRGPACRSKCSAWTKGRASTWRIIWAAPCN